MNTNLKWAIVGGLFLIPIIPFVVSGSILFPFIAGKNFLFRALVEVVFALWLILIVRDSEYRPKFSWLLGSVAIFTLVMGVADLFAENPMKALWSNFERMEGFVSLVHFFLYFLVASSVFHTMKQWVQYLYVWMASTVVMCIYGSLQLAGKITINQGGVRVDGTLGNANYLAVLLMFNIFFGIFLFLRSQSKKNIAWVVFPAIVFQGIILYFTATRGSVLGLIGGLFVAVVLTALFEKQNQTFRKVAIGGIVALLLFVGGFVALRNTSFVTSSPVLSRFSSLSLSELKTQGRFFIWPMAIEGFKERPILGWGQEGFSYVFNEHYNPKMYAQEQWFDRAHNMFLDWLIAGGILGLLSFLSILFFAFWYLWKDVNNTFTFAEKSLITGLLSAYIFQGIFVFDNLIGYILFFSLIAFIHAMHGGNHMAIPKALEKEGARDIVAAVVVIALCAVLYLTVWIPVQAGQSLINSLRAIQAGDPALSLTEFKKALSYNTFANPEIREQLVNAQGAFLQEKVPETVRGEFADLVRSEYAKQFAAAPKDARYYLFYGTFLRSVGLGDQAIENFKKAQELSPKKQTIIIEIGLTYLQGKDYPRAIEYFKKASELDPSYTQATVYYGVAAIYSGNTVLANEIFNSIPVDVLVNDEKVVQALAQTGRYQELVKIFTRRIAEGADTFENSTNLAVSYLESGDRTNAVAVLQRFLDKDEAQKNAQQKAQLEYFIKEIKAGRNP
jgi:O-antigen ligase/TPR repeat protein